MSEQDYQAKIMERLRARGCYVVNVVSASKAGVPDIIACCDGKFVAYETKLAYNKLSPLQKVNLKLIEDAGGIAVAQFKPKK